MTGKRKVILTFLICIAAVLAAAGNSYAQVDIWYANGEKYYNQGNYNEAEKYFSMTLDHDPNYFPAAYFRGMCKLLTERFDLAIDDFSMAINIDPSKADPYNNRGLAHGYIGNVEAAIADFDKAIQIEPDFTQAYLNRGSAYNAWYNFPKALEDFTKVIQLDPNNPATYYQRGLIFYKQKKFKKATRDFSSAINKGLKHAKIYFNRANSYFKSKKYKEAVADYTESLKLDPKDTETLNNRAMAYEEWGKKSLAKKDRDKLNEMAGGIFPDLSDIKFKKFIDDKKLMWINMPSDWHFRTRSNGDVSEFKITRDQLDNYDQSYSVGLWLLRTDNMSKNYNVKSEADLYQFWEKNLAENARYYKSYDIFEQKQFRRNGYQCYRNKVRILIDESMLPIRVYEFGAIRGDVLILGYFQAPERQFGYYKKIFDKALDTFFAK